MNTTATTTPPIMVAVLSVELWEVEAVVEASLDGHTTSSSVAVRRLCWHHGALSLTKR